MSKDDEMSREHRFEITEHTADVGVIGKGHTMAEAFENAAYGMFSIVTDLGKYQPTHQQAVAVAGADDVSLLERFLSSLLVIFDGDRLLPLDFDITEISMGRLVCWVSTRPIGDDIEWFGPIIKAVTYHHMAVESVGDEWTAKAIFDV